MFTLLCLVLAAFFKSVADTVADHYYVSVFRNLSERFWNKQVSWKYAKKVFAYPIDAWHLSNSCMIVCFVIGAVVYDDIRVHIGSFDMTIYGGFCVPVFGFAFIGVFNLFYTKILRK